MIWYDMVCDEMKFLDMESSEIKSNDNALPQYKTSPLVEKNTKHVVILGVGEGGG